MLGFVRPVGVRLSAHAKKCARVGAVSVWVITLTAVVTSVVLLRSQTSSAIARWRVDINNPASADYPTDCESIDVARDISTATNIVIDEDRFPATSYAGLDITYNPNFLQTSTDYAWGYFAGNIFPGSSTCSDFIDDLLAIPYHSQEVKLLDYVISVLCNHTQTDSAVTPGSVLSCNQIHHSIAARTRTTPHYIALGITLSFDLKHPFLVPVPRDVTYQAWVASSSGAISSISDGQTGGTHLFCRPSLNMTYWSEPTIWQDSGNCSTPAALSIPFLGIDGDTSRFIRTLWDNITRHQTSKQISDSVCLSIAQQLGSLSCLQTVRPSWSLVILQALSFASAIYAIAKSLLLRICIPSVNIDALSKKIDVAPNSLLLALGVATHGNGGSEMLMTEYSEDDQPTRRI